MLTIPLKLIKISILNIQNHLSKEIFMFSLVHLQHVDTHLYKIATSKYSSSAYDFTKNDIYF